MASVAFIMIKDVCRIGKYTTITDHLQICIMKKNQEEKEEWRVKGGREMEDGRAEKEGKEGGKEERRKRKKRMFY